MREDSLMTHDQMVAKWMENPEFRKVVFELDAQYAALDKALTKGKPNCSRLWQLILAFSI